MDDTNKILDDVKKMLSIDTELEEFNIDILSHVNSAFMTLYQLGIGPQDDIFQIDKNTTWGELETSVPKGIILDYLYLKTNVIFDPPASGSVMEAYKDRISELEFRMNVLVDSGGGDVSG
jgi:hypothetical protein